MLLGLRHRTVGRSDDQDCAVHLRRAGDHVLDVVGVARAVHVCVVPVRRLVLDVRRRNRDTALALFRRVVNRIKRTEQFFGLCFDNTFVIAAVNVVLP